MELVKQRTELVELGTRCPSRMSRGRKKNDFQPLKPSCWFLDLNAVFVHGVKAIEHGLTFASDARVRLVTRHRTLEPCGPRWLWPGWTLFGSRDWLRGAAIPVPVVGSGIAGAHNPYVAAARSSSERGKGTETPSISWKMGELHVCGRFAIYCC